MKPDELAYVNQQLAGMLQSGIPLEGALQQLCQTMRGGRLQTELQALQADLAKGTPLREALAVRQLPEFYKQMLLVGAKSNDLPGLLTLLADHYQRLHFTWTRLKGLMVYPLIVLAVSLGVSILIAQLFTHFATENANVMTELTLGAPGRHTTALGLAVVMWVPVIVLGLLCLATIFLLSIPKCRRWLKWNVPGFREAALSHLASALALLLEKGCDLNQALGLLAQLESRSPMQSELQRWQACLAGGQKQFSELAADGKVFPPLFVWLVAGAREDWVGGLRQAAQVYYERALQRVDTLLYAALPVSVLVLGFLIIGQVTPLLKVFTDIVRALGDVGGGLGE